MNWKHLISHRGNLNGANSEYENYPTYIDTALNQGFEAEVDIRVSKNKIYLGHDEPQYEINEDWLISRTSKLWIHCKNIEAIEYLNQPKKHTQFNYFWHEEDTLTITSKGFLWVYPGKQPVINSIAVMPEEKQERLIDCIGICSDYIQKYKIDKNNP